MEGGRWQASLRPIWLGGTLAREVSHLDVKYTCTSTCSLAKGTKSKLKCTRLWKCTCATLRTIIIITMYVRFVLIDLFLTFLDFFENASILTLRCFYAYKNAYLYKFSPPDSEYILNILRSDHRNKLLQFIYLTSRPAWGYQPEAWFFIWIVSNHTQIVGLEPYLQTSSQVQNFCADFKWLEQIYLSRPPTFCGNAPFMTPVMVLWETCTLI